MEVMLNTQLAVWKKKSIEQHCLTVGYSTWKVSEGTGSQVNTVQLGSLLLGKKHKSPKNTLWGMMSGITFVLNHPYAHNDCDAFHFKEGKKNPGRVTVFFLSIQFKQLY